MAMVKLSPANQLSSRPCWPPGTGSSSSSSSPDVDTPFSHAASANLGVIGEHRRGSRSSSVSSAGSSTNSIDGIEPSHQKTVHRFCGLPPHSQDNAVEYRSGSGYGRAGEKVTAEIATGKDGQLQLSAHEMQPRQVLDLPLKVARSISETSNQIGPKLDSSDPNSFSYFMAPMTTMDTLKQGRPITGQNTTANSFNSHKGRTAHEVDLQRFLSEPIFSPDHLVGSINQDMQYMGTQNYFDFSTGSLNLPTSSDSDMGALGASFQPASSTSFVGGTYHSGFLNQGSIQYSPNIFSGIQGMAEKNNTGYSFYSSQGIANGPGFHNSSSFTTNTGHYQGFGSQDFSLPPPVQSWQARGSFMPESMQKKVTCSVCNKNYKWPHALECCHVYCFPCLTSRYDSGERCIVCPECSHKTTLEDGPCSLKLDNQGARFMRDLNLSPFSCTACTRDTEAVITCTTCVAYLCTECRDGHRSMNQFQNHVLAPITKIGKIPDGDYTSFCERHPSEPMRKYCCVCERMICQVCTVDHKHSDYPNNINGCASLEEVYPIVVERLNNWNEDVLIKTKDMADIAKQAPLNMQHMESKRRSCRKQIDEYADYCKTVVEQNRQAAYELLDKTIGQMENESQAWTMMASKISKELETVTAFNTRTVKFGSITDTIDLLTLMESAYKRCVEHYSDLIKNNESIRFDLKFDPNYKESHSVLNTNFLSISYSVNGVEKKVSPSEGNQRNDASRSRNLLDYVVSSTDNSDCNYQRWSSAPDAMAISTWNTVSDRDRKNGTLIPHLNRCRTKTSYIHMFGDYGRGEYSFTEPSGQAYLKDGSYVICDTNNHRIVYYSANHEYIRTIGQPPNLPPVAEEPDMRNNGSRGKGFARQDGFLYFPNRVAVCPITQNIIATERPPSHDIQIFTITGEFVRCFGGNILQHPRGVTVDEEGVIIVVECKVMKLVMFNQDGTFIMSQSLAKDLEFPNDVAAKDKKIFISDNRGHCVQVFNYNAEHLYKIGNEYITFFPIGVSINHLNQVVVTDNHNTFNITVFDMTGTVLHIFESVSKLAQCHNVAVNPNSLELMLTTKDCSVYFFNYDPDSQHPLTPPASRRSGHVGMGGSVVRRPRGSVSGNSGGSSFY